MAKEQLRQDAIANARRDTADLLSEHKRFAAEIALVEGARVAFNDYMKIRSLMFAGGVHMVRLRGGRSIDRQ